MVKNLFTSNSSPRLAGVYTWTLPAHVATLTDGTRHTTCPQAGICAGLCYAKAGRWNFSNVKGSHVAKLEMVLADLEAWKVAVLAELSKKKYRGAFIRVHDAGDFFSEEYARAWLQVAAMVPDVTFYGYTKEVRLFKVVLAGQVPANFRVIFSYGGRQDALINPETDRHSNVFPTVARLLAAGYVQVCSDDKLAATSANHKIGLVSNQLPHLVKRQGQFTFAEMQTGARPNRATA
jgi:hypothetical protein